MLIESDVLLITGCYSNGNNSPHGREREIYSQNAGNQKGFRPSKLEPITNNIIMHKLEFGSLIIFAI